MHSSTLSCDVVVAGGGVAGVAAAIAAGRAGAHVVLLERNAFLGGTATAAQVGTVCGLFLRDASGEDPKLVSGGFVREFATRLRTEGGQDPLRLENGLWVLPYSAPLFAHLADEMLAECKNITLALHATVSNVQVTGSRCEAVSALAWNEPLLVQARAVVDCTGEATAACLAGTEVEEGLTEQAPALVFSLEGVDLPPGPGCLLEVRRELRRAVEDGALPAACERLALVPAARVPGRISLKLNLSPAPPDDPPWRRITSWERESRTLVRRIHRRLASALPSFRHARVANIAPHLGVRSGRRVTGLHQLTDPQVMTGAKHPQGVARGCWPMERWGHAPRPEMAFFAEGEYYEIPLDCLRCAAPENLWAAGRCCSASPAAMTSARVMGTSLGTGWAAGTAAAFQAEGRPLEDAIAAIRCQMCE